MEDTSVKKGYYAYMLRVDISLNDIDNTIDEYLSKYQTPYWLIGKEIAPETKKEHIQGIIWYENRLKDSSNHRLWWKKRANKTVQPVALTSAKKIKNLIAYCKKDENWVTNLTELDCMNIVKWIPKVTAAGKKEKMEEFLCKEENKEDLNQNTFIRNAIQAYYEIYDNLPRYSMVEKWLYRVGSDSQRDYIKYYKYKQIFDIVEQNDNIQHTPSWYKTLSDNSDGEEEYYEKETINYYIGKTT